MLVPFCCVFVLFSWNIFLLLLLWNKHWLFNSKGCSIKEYEQKHAFLNFIGKKKIWFPGWTRRLRSSSKYKNGKCLQIGVMSCLINFCYVKIAWFNWTGSWCCVETKFPHLVFNPTFGIGQHYMDTNAPPIFALELAEAIVHIQVKWVYAGVWAPIPESPVRTFSHLSTCEILHTSHNWSMTVSANCIRCFFYMLFTQIIWIIVLVDFGASFLM